MAITKSPGKLVDHLKVLHLYRRLLRAITYLPDSQARTVIHNEVVDRFKGNAHTFEHHLVGNRVKKARAAVRCCEQAGKGNMDDLKKVLLHTYGRAGARRRTLLQDLLRTDESVLPKDDSALKQLIEAPEISKPRLSPKVAAFIESQKQNHPPESERSKVRNYAKIEKTIWGREPPRKLEKSRWKKWWATTLDRLLPPVPQHEWDHLRDLATGHMSLDEFPNRRSWGVIREEERAMEAAKDKKEMKEEAGEEEEDDTKPYRYLQLRLKSEAATLYGATFDPQRGLMVKVKGPEEALHAVSRLPPDRSRRRLYALIWSMTPKMSQDEVGKMWKIEWGIGKGSVVAGHFSQPTGGYGELFEGIDNIAQPEPQDPEKWAMERDAKRAMRLARWREGQSMEATT